MSTTSQKEDQEIDLTQLSKKIGSIFENIAALIFQVMLFVKRNIIIIGILFILGAVLGWKMDQSKQYDSQIIVTANFSSVEYLYAKIDLINSKIGEGDTQFLKNVVGIKYPENFNRIEVKPISDIYRFIGAKQVNFDFVKLLAEAGDLNKIVDDELTSKNYMYHNITFSTSKITNDKSTVIPILNYLNDSDYYKKIQGEYVKNVNQKMIENDSIISQIDEVLLGFSKKAKATDKLVYYNENTQLDDILKTKDALNDEQGRKRLELISIDKIIKDVSSVSNIKNNKSLNGKMKLIVPMLFMFLFTVVVIIRLFYKRQLAKSKNK